jgi:hypothetical protein
MSRRDFANELDRELDARGDAGAEAFRDALDVTMHTVNEWRKGRQQPARSRWKDIEDALAWPANSIRELMDRVDPAHDRPGLLEQLVSALERNTAALERNTSAIDFSTD